ncbi:MAG: hypothetical protein FD123_3678 [Bacteroidetes bacterium]|nr:MAG: hypothetical protein FD123_3678 [Bacteroidota bacterium]
MKNAIRSVLLLLALSAVVISSSSFTPGKNPPQIKFVKLIHDFGVMKPGEKKTCDFVFSNTGDEPLKILSAKSGLDFIKVEYPTTPIKKGGKESIKVTFDAPGKAGQFNKTILIDSNSSGTSSQVRVTVKALISKE